MLMRLLSLFMANNLGWSRQESSRSTCKQHSAAPRLPEPDFWPVWKNWQPNAERTRSMLAIVPDGRRLVGRGLGFPPQRSYLHIIVRHEISDDNSHRSIAEHFGGWIVVGCRSFQNIASDEFVPTFIEESYRRHAQQLSLAIDFGIERGDRLLARDIFEDNALRIIVHVSADSQEHTRILQRDHAFLYVFPGLQVIA